MPRHIQAHGKVLTLILAGGRGSRLGVLTKERAKPVMPFAGTLRLIDFALSNCMHSDLKDVWVIEQHELHSLNEHLSNGRPWDLDRTYGGLQVLPPYTAGTDDDEDGRGEGGFAAGNADAIYRHRRLIRDFDPDILLVLSADHVYKLDYNDVIRAHTRRRAGVTIVTKQIPTGEASRFGTVFVDDDDRVTEFEYKPKNPRSGIVTTEVFVYDAEILLRTLDELAGENIDDGADGRARLKDFGHELIPRLVSEGRAFAYPFEGYWRDLGTLESYWGAHMDLLSDSVELDLTDTAWTIRTFNPQQLPARIHGTANIANSLISPGCTIRGTVISSVLAPNVEVAADAVIENSVINSGVVIGPGARLSFSIVDAGVSIGADARIGALDRGGTTARIRDDDLTIIGRRARIRDGVRVQPGSQIEPDADA